MLHRSISFVSNLTPTKTDPHAINYRNRVIGFVDLGIRRFPYSRISHPYSSNNGRYYDSYSHHKGQVIGSVFDSIKTSLKVD